MRHRIFAGDLPEGLPSPDDLGGPFDGIVCSVVLQHLDRQLLFERAGFDTIGRWDNPDGLGRQGRDWTTSLFTLRSTGVSRPLDLIEAVLRRDR